jgi:cell division protein FtsB
MGDQAAQGERRRPRRIRRRRFLLPLIVVAALTFFYYRPISTYLETRGELSKRRSQVAALQAERAALEQRLERSKSLEALAREARHVGYIRPGEQLFIVKGITGWRRANGVTTR